MTYERPNPTTVTEVLQGTKEVLRQRGRTRCINFHSDGTVCLNGAVQVATGLATPDGRSLQWDPARSDLIAKTFDALNVIARIRSGYGAVRYNDLPETTDEDVYAAIDAAIAAEKGIAAENAAEAGGAA